MSKHSYKYHVLFSMVQNKENTEELPIPLELDFESHEDIFHIVDAMRNSNHFADEQQATEFALGLKLFSGVMLKNRDSELFKELQPAFGDFMKKLKRNK